MCRWMSLLFLSISKFSGGLRSTTAKWIPGGMATLSYIGKRLSKDGILFNHLFLYCVSNTRKKPIFPMTISLWLSHGYYPNSPDSSTNSNGMLSFPSFLLFFVGMGNQEGQLTCRILTENII